MKRKPLMFADINEFHLGSRFFMLRPSNAVYRFIFILTAIFVIIVVWSLIAKMDDIVRADALLRPGTNISSVRTLIAGEVLEINFTHNSQVNEGDLLFRIDTAGDILELSNSKILMERIDRNIEIHETLLGTINSGRNAAVDPLSEAYVFSNAYLLEHRRHILHIEELRIRLERERTLPDAFLARQTVENTERELELAELQAALWRNSRILAANENLRSLMQNRENLERRISDLERNIRNANVLAPISGTVNDLRRLNIGDNVLPGEEILSIVPDNESGLRVDLFIDPAHIARLRLGQTVVLRFPGLPPSRFGSTEAVINLIPADYALLPGLPPIFIVEAKLEDPWLVSPRGEKTPLRPGISATGRVIVDRNTVFMVFLRQLDFISDSF